MMTYQEAREYLREASDYGSVLGLNSIKELLQRLGNPQEQLKFVHIAGTNGKGSTLAFISAMLKCAGHKTGRYLSPAVMGEREFIQVDELWITEEGFAEGISKIKEAADTMIIEGLPHPTVFEIETALGFLYFLGQRCDIVVLEVGLGGEEDATNVIKTTVLSIITPISLDHTQVLGVSLEQIASHKAGIIKPFVPVIMAKQLPEAEKVIRRVCVDNKSCLWTTEPMEIQFCGYEGAKQRFHYKKYENLTIVMAGRFQIENACTAIEAAEELERLGFGITEEVIREGLITAYWPGRFQTVHEKPLIVIDGAHNEDAAKSLRQSIDLYFTNRHIVYIMGVLADKDYKKIIEITHSAAKEIITITPDNKRALDAEKLAEAIREVHTGAEAADSLNDAIRRAIKAAGAEGVIIAFGSLSYLGQFIKVLEGVFHDR